MQMPKIRNIIIFTAIAVALILVYIFFIKPSSGNQASLVSSTSTLPNTNTGTGAVSNETSLATEDFLTLLLNTQSIKLNDSIFSDPAFSSLHDSTIVLVPDATTGRPNPFAQFGSNLVPVGPVNPIVTPITTPATTPVPVKTSTPVPASSKLIAP
jgi:hypothetical protein